jgi:hypothetical protein
MFAKKLFYASAALFLLAASYHLGATNAKAAKPIDDPIVGIAYEQGNVCSGPVAVSQSGNVYAVCPGPSGPFVFRGSVPGPVAGITKGSPTSGGITMIVLQNGDVYWVTGDTSGEAWTFTRMGNVRG